MTKTKRVSSFPSPDTPKRNKNTIRTECVEDLEIDLVVTPKRNKRTNCNEDTEPITPKRSRRVDPNVSVLITPKKNKTRAITSNYANETVAPKGEHPVVTVLITPKKNETQTSKQIVTPPSIR